VNAFSVQALALAAGLALSSAAVAQTMSKEQYKSGKDSIAAAYKTEKEACGSLSGNARDICKAEADGKEMVAKAELEAAYKPSVQVTYNVRAARAHASFLVAREMCDDKAGNVKDVCIKEVKAAEVAAKADAKSRMKTAEARNEASSATRDADYAVAKEKCDTYSGDAKSSCMNEAKARFGKT
jgi:hypothetical protein